MTRVRNESGPLACRLLCIRYTPVLLVTVDLGVDVAARVCVCVRARWHSMSGARWREQVAVHWPGAVVVGEGQAGRILLLLHQRASSRQQPHSLCGH